jgi:CRP/FNR family transcriptional activator FtrB
LLCRQGELATRLYVLLDGQVTLSNVVHGDVAAVVEVVQTGGHFVLSTVLARLPYLMSATATTPARVVDIDGAGLVALIQQEPRIASAMLRAGAMDFSAMVRQVCDLKLRTTAQRLGCYLLELTGDETENSVSFRLPFDKRLLAARLGCRQENLSRAFATLRGLGVETHGSRVILHDIERLRNYATPVSGDAAVAQA